MRAVHSCKCWLSIRIYSTSRWKHFSIPTAKCSKCPGDTCKYTVVLQLVPSINCARMELPQDMRDFNSLRALKRKLNADNIKPPSYFNFGSGLCQICYARLRTHRSSLNIVDSPLCVYGDVESTHHYLFDCTRYGDLRRELLIAVSHYCEPAVNTILLPLTFTLTKIFSLLSGAT